MAATEVCDQISRPTSEIASLTRTRQSAILRTELVALKHTKTLPKKKKPREGEGWKNFNKTKIIPMGRKSFLAVLALL